MAVLSVSGSEFSGQIFTLSTDPLLIGRGSDCEIVCQDKSVSSKHARILWHDKLYYVQDLGSQNGVFVGRKRVNQFNLLESPVFHIGPYEFRYARDISEIEAATDESVEEIRRAVHSQLITALNLKQLNLEQMLDRGFRDKAERELNKLVEAHKSELPKSLDREVFKKNVLDAALGLGPLEDLLADPTVTEIMVNAPDKIFIEQNGRLTKSREQFISKADIYTAIERIVGPIGRRIDESSPLVDARLSDGSRVNIIIPPLALDSPMVTIRKFPEQKMTIEKLLGYNSLSSEMAQFLQLCIEKHLNIVISGGTGSGKTTLLNVLASFIDNSERILTIEDSAELQLPQDHVGRLETRPANIEGKGAYTIRDLVKNALRMRPDRIVVGECRGGEALDMIQAMNTGHDGSLTTAHANSPEDMLRRMETMVLMAGMDLPLAAVRENVASAIHLIVQINRFSDGTRKITAISEVTEIYDGSIRLSHIFEYRKTGVTPDGKVQGYFTPTGIIPKFVEEMVENNEKCDMGLFVPVTS